MQIETMMSDQLARYLDLAANQTKLTAENMANVDTPGYRAVGMDFEAEMRQSIFGIEAGLPGQKVRLRAEENLITRPDGNNVSMDRESLHLAEAQLRFKTGVTLLKQEYQTEMDAIHADGK